MKRKQIYIFLIALAATFSCIKFKELATLTTNITSNLTINSVTCGGNITNGGSADITARGVCWSTSQSPTTAGSHTTDGTGTGSFTSSITGLDPDTKYYIRAYATNSAGTAYGNEVSFKTIALTAPTLTTFTATEIGSTTAKSGGTISSDGGAPITARGVCWSTSVNPTTDGLKSSDGSGSSDFVSNITGLSPATIYYYRAYATNSAGTAYGNELDFTTTCAPATATTNSATNVSASTANLNGTINANGSSTTVTFEYGKTTSYGNTVTASQSPVTGSSNIAVTGALSGLDINTTYHFRVKAVNCGGTTNGTDQAFTTICIAATAITNSSTNLTNTTATLNGTVNANSSSTTVTFEYGTTASYGSTVSATPGTVNGSSNTSVSASISSLTSGMLYHYRVKGFNCGGTTNGNDLTFTTTVAVVLPTVTTTAISAVTSTTASSGGNVTDAGNGTISARGVCWATTPSPVATGSHTIDGTGTGSFPSSITGLTPNTLYYVRAYATNSAGTAYGSDLPFTTSVAVSVPVVHLDPAYRITSNFTETSIQIISDGGLTLTEKGICWSTSANPTISDFKMVASNTDVFSYGFGFDVSPNTTYYLRGYAINSMGTGYSNEITFTTPPSAIDFEGNIYKTVIIGSQVWMVENLKTTRYNDGSTISPVTDNASWSTGNPAYCWYGNDISNKNAYGALYNWPAVNTGRLCPAGWHVPTDPEWKILEMFLGMSQVDADATGRRGTGIGVKLKSISGWDSGGNGTNESGFTGLPAGDRSEIGTFGYLGIDATWWSSTPFDSNNSWFRNLNYNYNNVQRGSFYNPDGFSVRCVKD